jgi:hypothetical protein
MQTNLEQAIATVVHSSRSVTLANTFPAYMQAAGFKFLADPKVFPVSSAEYESLAPAAQWQLFSTSVCGDALISFERAMDKQPLGGRREYVAEIRKLREEYWKAFHGSTGSKQRSGCRCRNCGLPIGSSSDTTVDGASSLVEHVSPEPHKRKREPPLVLLCIKFTVVPQQENALTASSVVYLRPVMLPPPSPIPPIHMAPRPALSCYEHPQTTTPALCNKPLVTMTYPSERRRPRVQDIK